MNLLSGSRLNLLQNNKLEKICFLFSYNGGGRYSHTLPIQVCVAQRGRDFEAPGLERGIITYESSSFVSSHLKLFKDRLLLKILFNALTSKL